MKVLHVISDTNIGGAGVLLCTLLRHFDRKHVESRVALPKGSALKARIDALGIPTVELHTPCDRFSIASVREILNLLKHETTDIVHANAALCARIAGKRFGVAVLHTRHCCFPLNGIYRVPPIRKLSGIWNQALSDRVIATADAAAQNLYALGIPKEKIDVIINGSEPIRTVSEKEQASFQKAWNFNQNTFTVGIAARLVEYKGHETFLRAAKAMIETLPHVNFCFLIAGEGPQRPVLEDMAKTLGISESVRFLGFLSDMAPFYRSLRVNVNCSMGTETSCLALSEGMSAGVPMVISDYGGNCAMLGDSMAGEIYPAGDAEALAKAVCRIASNAVLETRMKKAAYERYQTYYTAAQMTDRVTSLYESVLMNRGAFR